jgi:hypothetical protein
VIKRVSIGKRYISSLLLLGEIAHFQWFKPTVVEYFQLVSVMCGKKVNFKMSFSLKFAKKSVQQIW